jgi:hypothetical protein
MTESESEFGTQRPEDIRSNKANLAFLCLKQLDRANHILSLSQSRRKTWEGRANLCHGVYFSLMSIESMLSNYLPETYYKEATKLKARLNEKIVVEIDGEKKKLGLLQKLECYGSTYKFEAGVDVYLELCSQWYSLLVKNFGAANLLPAKDTSFDFGGDGSFDQADS